MKYTGKIIAIVRREDDIEEKGVVCPQGMNFTAQEITEKIHFQEQYFNTTLYLTD